MKNALKKALPLLLVVAVLAMSGMQLSCRSSSRSQVRGQRGHGTREMMYERHQSNKGRKVNTNIKVKGNNRANGRTTRSY